MVQRVEAALGTTLSQQANVVSGARPDAVTQPANPDRPDATRNETQRHPREVVDRAAAQAEQQGRHAVDKAKLDVRTAALLLARGATSASATPSAPTTLGFAARTILNLLANFPDQAPVTGRRPLLNPGGQGDARALRDAAGGATGSGATAGRAAGAAGATATGGLSNSAQASGTSAGATGSGSSTSAGVTGPGAAMAASGAMAATGSNATMAGQLANALAQALQSSGMFYESHLSGLAFGKQSLAHLMQEPQAMLGRSTSQSGQSGAASSGSGTAGAAAAGSTALAHSSTTAMSAVVDAAASTASASAAGAGAATRGDATLLATTLGGTALATANAASAAAAANPVPGLDPQTQLLVRQQLDVLANQSFSWRGEAWPGAPMDWEISRRDRSSQEADASPQTDHWATRISIQLPQLGTVQARLTLAGQQLVMHLVAPESAPLLAEHTESLRSRYIAQGLQLSQISVAADEVDGTEPGST